MSNISKTSQTLYDETWTIWSTPATQLAGKSREKSVRPFSSKCTRGHKCSVYKYSSHVDNREIDQENKIKLLLVES